MSSDQQIRLPNCPATFIDTLSGVFGPPVWVGNSIDWKSWAGPVRANIHIVDAVTDGGRHLQGAITVAQELRLASPELAKAMAARYNQQPALGAALVLETSPDTIAVMSRISLYGDEEDIRDKLGLTLAIAVLANMITSLDYGLGRQLPPLPHHDQPSRWWREQEVMFLAWQMHRRGDRPWINGTRLVARIAFPEGWLPDADDNGNPTVVLNAQRIHPCLGHGLSVENSLGVDLPEEQVSTLVSSLNRLEAESVTGPPLLGAWTVSPSDQRLSFRSFWPNLAYIPGFLDHIASWQRQRLVLAKDLIVLASTRCVA